MHSQYVITLVSPAPQKLDETAITATRHAAEQAGFAITDQQWLGKDEACDILLHTQPQSQYSQLLAAIKDGVEGADAILQPLDDNRRKKLLISDMDSTIIQQECIDELADEMGIKPRVADITERAMRGELDFKSALRERVALLAGLDVNALQRVYEQRIQLMPGAQQLVATMRHHGAYCMLVSGGFAYFTSQLRDRLGFDSDSANILEVRDGKLSGTVVEPILDKDAKLHAMKEAAYRQDIRLAQCLALGDGANDLPMIEAAGLGIAYHAKPAVREAARACINHGDLTVALYAQGYHKHEWVA